MAIEEIRYDFREHPEQFHSYFTKIMKLIIISKLNCLEKNLTSLKYFNEIISRIEGCDIHKIRYGKPMIFTKFFGHEFNYHTVRVKIKIIDKYAIDISLESIIPDFVKTFDKLVQIRMKSTGIQISIQQMGLNLQMTKIKIPEMTQIFN